MCSRRRVCSDAQSTHHRRTRRQEPEPRDRQMRHLREGAFRTPRSRSRCSARTPRAVAAQAAALPGVQTVLRVDRPENAHPLAAIFAPQIAALAADYTHVFGPSTSFGKDLMPRVAALLGVPQVSDLMAVEGAYRFRRPIYAGNAIVTVEADPRASSSPPCGSPLSRRRRQRRQRRDRIARPRASTLPSHTRYVRRQIGCDRPARPADRLEGRLGRPRPGQRRELQAAVQPRRQDRRRGRRIAGRGRRRLRRQRDAGGPDRQDHLARRCTSRSASPARSSI